MAAPGSVAKAPSRWPAPRADRPEVVYDSDKAYHDLYDRAVAATGMRERAMRRQRHYLIPQVLRCVAGLPGDAAEVGCYRGLSSFVACSTLAELGVGTPYHIYDSFEGLSPLAPKDQSAWRPVSTEPQFVCTEEEVRANLSMFPQIRYHPGWIPDCFTSSQDCRFSYVHIDVDLYGPTGDSLAFFWPRLCAGGVVVFDDYGTVFYPGARQAIDEYFAGRADVFLVETPAGSAVAVKTAAG